MRNIRHNTLVLLLTLASLMGQVMASSVMSCAHLPMDMSPKSISALSMEHTNMAINAQHNTTHLNESTHQSSTPMDCCQDQCQCAMSGCVGMSFLAANSFNFSPFVDQKIPQLALVLQSPITTSLYRPPIS